MKLLKSISSLIAWLSIWEIILGFNGDIISLGPIKIRALLAVLNIFLLILSLSMGASKIRVPKLIVASFLLMSLFGSLWTSYGILRGNEFAVADGQGLIFSISILAITNAVLDSQLNRSTLTRLFQIPLFILFSLISILWLSKPLLGVDTDSIVTILNGITSIQIIGANNELGRFYFLNTTLLSLSVFIFSIDSIRYSTVKFYFYMILYAISILAIGSRAIGLSCIALMILAFIFKIFKMRKKPTQLIFFLLPLIVLTVFTSPLIAENIKGTRFFNDNASQAFDASDEVRSEQALFLLDEFYTEPILGKGSGYYIKDYQRSESYEFSYELFFLALLMKTGILGLAVYLSSICCLLLGIRRQNFEYQPRIKILYIVIFITTLIEAASNPFLDRQVGLLLLFGPWLIIELFSRISPNILLRERTKFHGSQSS
jgi:O-Antigen ligase